MTEKVGVFFKGLFLSQRMNVIFSRLVRCYVVDGFMTANFILIYHSKPPVPISGFFCVKIIVPDACAHVLLFLISHFVVNITAFMHCVFFKRKLIWVNFGYLNLGN